MLILLPYVLAADFHNQHLSSPDAPEQLPSTDRFNEFTVNVQSGDFSVASQFDQFIPNWLTVFHNAKAEDSLDYSQLMIDPQFKAHLDFLNNPEMPMPDQHQGLLEPITAHLRLTAKKIVATLNNAAFHFKGSEAISECFQGLQGLAMQLAKNAHAFPALLDELAMKDIMSGPEAHSVAAMTGLLGGGIREADQSVGLHTVGKQNYPANVRAIIRNSGKLKDFSATSQLNLSWHMSKLLTLSEEVVPSDEPSLHQLIENLASIRQANFYLGRKAQEQLHQIVNMVPVGHRFALGIRCKESQKQASIVDLIKATDGFAYGIVYAVDRSPFAFSIPSNRLNKLLTRLRKSNDLNSVSSLRFTLIQEIKLAWYPAEEATSALHILKFYANAWPIRGRLRMGAIWHVCQMMEKGGLKKLALDLQNNSGDWQKIADGLAQVYAKPLYQKIKDMKSGQGYQSELAQIKRRIFALIQV